MKYYEVKNWICQTGPVEWCFFIAAVVCIVIVHWIISCCLCGQVYILGQGLRKKAQKGDIVLGVVVSAGIWGFTVMGGPVITGSQSWFRCRNMLRWGKFKNKNSSRVKRHIKLFKKTISRIEEWDRKYDKESWYYYAFCRVSWLRYLIIRKRHFPLKVIYEDGIVSRRLRKNVDSIAIVVNWTAISDYRFCDKAEPLTRRQGKLLMNKYIKFNNTCSVVMNDMFWDDFVCLDDGTFLHQYGIMKGAANGWYIDGSLGREVTLYACGSWEIRVLLLLGFCKILRE